MAKFIKGNYRLPKGKNKSAVKKTRTKKEALTARFEEGALAKLGGSICCVMKGKTFVWKEDEVDEAGDKTR